MTWREHLALVNQLIAGLDALGAAPGDAIAILSGTRWEWMAADWAIFGLGGVTVTIYPSNVPSVVAFILTDSRTRYVFAENRAQYEKLLGLRDELPEVRKVILFDDGDELTQQQASTAGGTADDGGDDSGWAMSFAALRALSRRSTSEADAFAAARADEIAADDRLSIIYTSGTTGMPKGVVHTHASALAQLACIRQMLPTMRPGMVDLLFLPLAHVFGRAEHISAYDVGLETVIVASLDTLLREMAAAKPDLFFSVPRIYEKAYAAVQARVAAGSWPERRIFAWAERVGRAVSRRKQDHQPIPARLQHQYRLADRLVFAKIRAVLGGNLKFAITAGAPLEPRILEFFNAAGVLLLEGWGMTETCAGFTLNTVEHYRFGTVGRVFPGQELRIAEDGEILVRGPVVFAGYHNNPAASLEAIDADGWFATGDIGTLDADGFLRIVDRKKDLIITSGGKNLAPQHVENTLKALVPCVSQVAVYGDRKPYLVALLTLDPEAVRAWAREHGVSAPAGTSEGEAHSAATQAEAEAEAPFDVASVAALPAFRAYLDECVRAANATLASYETVKYYDVLPDDFTVENELLTPSLKVRRRAVHERYRARYEALYHPAPAAVGQRALGSI